MLKKFFCIPVILIGFFFLMAVDSHAQAASLTIDPSTQTVAVDSIFTVEIRVNTDGTNVNTVAANLSFNSADVTPQTIDQSGSFVSIWFENSIGSDEVRMTGSVPSPGVSGDNLLFARVTFLANAANTTQIAFNDDSAIFRDSDNVDILTSSVGSVVTITTEAVTPTPTGQGTTPAPTSATTITPGTSPTPGSGTGSPTPSDLPDAGIVAPTVIFLGFGILLLIVAIILLV
ncbi:hypothetical protein KC571_00520 [candidate division WWE3 bacterium]|uniref:Cohesin domain-containing protein n=1 Tax=candidate division WWE3 bacterium TaxID=2053526 RepID=A0A955LG43_UNCKA|nr:hypothetical protein [candidate division WWE3 bacterium]